MPWHFQPLDLCSKTNHLRRKTKGNSSCKPSRRRRCSDILDYTCHLVAVTTEQTERLELSLSTLPSRDRGKERQKERAVGEGERARYYVGNREVDFSPILRPCQNIIEFRRCMNQRYDAGRYLLIPCSLSSSAATAFS